MTISYDIGDATEPYIKTGTRIIAHICNDAGKWGAGFSGAVSRKWRDPEDYYRSQAKHAKGFRLGAVQWQFVEVKLAVVNMIAQQGVRSSKNPKPIRYEALAECLDRMAEGARALEKNNNKVTIHMPRIGCGLAGGTWDKVLPLIEENLWDFKIYVYDLEE